MQITMNAYGMDPHNNPVTEYTITNAPGASVSVMDLGATVTRILMPDQNGKLGDVVLGYDTAEGYMQNGGYLGALIGRFGNRIGDASFDLDGNTYPLQANNGKNNLHGGPEGFDRRMFSVAEIQNGLRFTLTSPDGDQGFPGTLQVTADYTLSDDNVFSIRYHAVTDKPTLVNLTNHSYFNLDGHDAGDVKDLVLQVFADAVTEVDNGLIPTGTLIPAADVVYGFQTPTRVGDVLDHPDAAMKNAGGVDFNFCAGKPGQNKRIATLYSPKTGREMQVFTDLPGVQVYTGQGLNQTGKGGVQYHPYAGLCLETQGYPDAIHHANFPSVVLRPGEEYITETSFRFSVR
ncbi:MAG TPA: aldose epimerase family protein [Candidatus Limiplasma sp.]|nr:aldose epimerase family protein [Candidatus Limiplasma sp.]HRX08099.1 aldose epimerase family protein [Candidatus Limiplasma sp.]